MRLCARGAVLLALAGATLVLAAGGRARATDAPGLDAQTAPPAASGAAGAAAAPAGLVVTDQTGRQVSIPAKVARIVSLAPCATEILYAIGVGDRVAAVGTDDDYPPGVRAKPALATYPYLDVEKLVALAPDLVLAGDINVPIVPSLEARKIPVVVLDPKDLAGVTAAIRLAGEVTDAKREAEDLARKLEARIAAVRARTAALAEAERPRILYVILHRPIWTGGRGTFIDDLIAIAGGKNLFADLEGWVEVSLEAIVARDPQAILISSSEPRGSEPKRKDARLGWALDEPRLKDTDARQRGRVGKVDANLIQRPGPRVVDGLEEIARFLHPELFP